MIKPSTFQLGSRPPILPPDAGAGPWRSMPATVAMRTMKGLLDNALTKGLAAYFGGEDAVAHIAHYFRNGGTNLTIDFAKLVREVPKAKRVYDTQVAAAKAFVARLPPGRHTFTSTSGSLNHPITQADSRNWFFAVGSFTTWGSGTAQVGLPSGRARFAMDWQCHFFDRYNWDGGKSVSIPLPGYGTVRVTDAFMGEFHRMGLAHEFNMVGTIRERLYW